LMSYGPDAEESFHSPLRGQSSQGAKPSELPVEQPTRFELVVNSRIVAILGINIPPSVLLRIDRMIE